MFLFSLFIHLLSDKTQLKIRSMKKLFLSASAVSLLFLSCDKNSEETPVQEGQLVDLYTDIAYIHDNMYTQTPEELLKVFDKFKAYVATDAVSDVSQWIQNVKPNGQAAKGTAGLLGKRYLDEKGVETGQLIKKGLIGAFQLNQALQQARKLTSTLSNQEQENVLKDFSAAIVGSYAAVDNQKETIEDKKGNYLGYKVNKGNEFAKYLNAVNNTTAFAGISDDLYNALKEAKKNIGNQTIFTTQVMKALTTTQKVVAIRGVYYLKYIKDLNGENLTAETSHAISEGLGFLYSLQYTYNPTTHRPYLSRNEVMDILNNLDLWDGDKSGETLENISKKIAEDFGFDWYQA